MIQQREVSQTKKQKNGPPSKKEGLLDVSWDKGCPCSSGHSLGKCCGLFLKNLEMPQTAEALMRSRYSAFVFQEIDYLIQTHDSKTRHELDREGLESWSRNSTWLGLKVLDVVEGGVEDSRGEVEFVAFYSTEVEGEHSYHERATFIKKEGHWYFEDGALVKKTYRRPSPKVGRNSPCPCGSGLKFKKCCALS